MSGAVSLVLGSSSVAMVTQTQYAGKVMASMRSSESNNRIQSLQLGSAFGASKSNCSFCCLSSSSVANKTAVAAFNTDTVSSGDLSDKKQPNRYHFVVANAKFMLDEEEHFQELMFERLRNYGERDKEQDFWLVVEPKFLDSFPNITKRLKRPAVALVSTNAPWITYMKLRLDRVLSDSYEADSLEEALASNPTDLNFEMPANWVAPYSKYESGWWQPFLPQVVKEKAQV